MIEIIDVKENKNIDTFSFFFLFRLTLLANNTLWNCKDQVFTVKTSYLVNFMHPVQSIVPVKVRDVLP